MKKLNRIYQALIEGLKQALLPPQTVTKASKHGRLRSVRNEFELDRLDRLRNPSKYQGK